MGRLPKYITSKQLTLVNDSAGPVLDSLKIGNSHDAHSVFRKFWNKDQIEIREEFHILALSRSNKVIGHSVISIGGMSGTVADGKIIFSTLLQMGSCSAFICCHNHPSGNTKPSQADISLTKKLKDFGAMIDLQLLDHLILTESSYLSFADEGLI